MINAAVLTISDSVSAGTRTDRSGPAVRERLEQLGWRVSVVETIADEVDEISRRLATLADGGQVLCITHLPQIASLAQRHFSIEKEQSGEVARAEVAQLAGDAVVEELCRMLGADTTDKGARRHAKELLAAA